MSLFDQWKDEIDVISSGVEEYCDEMTLTRTGWGIEFTISENGYVITSSGKYNVTKWQVDGHPGNYSNKVVKCKTAEEVNEFLRSELMGKER